MIVTNLSLIRKQLDAYTAKQANGSREARNEMASAMVQLAMEEIKGERPYSIGSQGGKVYEKAIAGHPPMNRSGNLRRSIKAELFDISPTNFSALIGPTVIYGRSVEMGGEWAPRSWQGTTAMKGFPYMAPAFAKFSEVMPSILRKHLG